MRCGRDRVRDRVRGEREGLCGYVPAEEKAFPDNHPSLLIHNCYSRPRSRKLLADVLLTENEDNDGRVYTE